MCQLLGRSHRCVENILLLFVQILCFLIFVIIYIFLLFGILFFSVKLLKQTEQHKIFNCAEFLFIQSAVFFHFCQIWKMLCCFVFHSVTTLKLLNGNGLVFLDMPLLLVKCASKFIAFPSLSLFPFIISEQVNTYFFLSQGKLYAIYNNVIFDIFYYVTSFFKFDCSIDKVLLNIGKQRPIIFPNTKCSVLPAATILLVHILILSYSTRCTFQINRKKGYTGFLTALGWAVVRVVHIHYTNTLRMVHYNFQYGFLYCKIKAYL